MSIADSDDGATTEELDRPPPALSMRRRWREWYVLIVVIGMVAVVLGPSLTGFRTLLSVNVLSAGFPWVALHGSQLAGHTTCTGDTIDSVLPGIARIRHDLFSGQLGTWQSVVSGGGPLSSVPDSGLLDPLSLPYYVLPLWLAPAFVVLLEFVAGIGGMFLFLRRLSVGRPAAALAGLIFVTSGFMVMWTNWPQTRVAALIPALFWAVERLIQRTRLTDAVLLAVVVASMIFGGFPEVTGFSLYLASGYFIVRMLALHRSKLRDCWRAVGLALGALVLGVALTMVQLLPFLSFYNQENLGYRASDGKIGLPFSGLLTLIAPNANGLCTGLTPTRGPTNPVELVAYVGSAAVVLAVAGAAFGLLQHRSAGRGMRGYFVAAVIVMVGLGWVSRSARDIAVHFPVFSNNPIGRIRALVGFGLAVLAALGFDWMTSRASRRHTSHLQADRRRQLARKTWAWLVWIGCAIFGAAVLWRANRVAVAGGYWSSVLHTAWIPVALVAVTLVIVGLTRLNIASLRTFAFILVPILVAVQGGQFFHTVLPGDSLSNFYPQTGTHKYLEAHIGNERFASAGGVMYPATALYYGLRTPTGHAFVEPAWRALLQRVDPSVMLTPTFSQFSNSLNQDNIGNQPILDRMGVKYFVLSPSQLAGRAQPLPTTNGSTTIANGPGGCTIPGQALRGVTVQLARPLIAANAARGVTLDVTVHDKSQTVSSARYLGATMAAGSVAVAVAGEDLTGGGTDTIEISATGTQGGMTLATDNGAIACAAVGPLNDGLKVVYADAGSIVYQRLSALPRIRWASASVVLGSSAQRISAIAQGLPANEVVLDAPGPATSGRPASISVTDDSDDEIAAKVSAEGGGYLVVGDALQQSGWSVSVDGKTAKLVPADEAMGGVFVPAGAHNVEFRYEGPGEAKGAALSGFAVIVAVVLVWWDRRRHPKRRSSTTPPITQNGEDLSEMG